MPGADGAGDPPAVRRWGRRDAAPSSLVAVPSIPLDRRALGVLLVLCAAGATGCGGGEEQGAGAPSPVPGTPGTATDSGDAFRTLVVSVCADTVRSVPPVPGRDASEATAQRYVVAVRRATRTLAADLDRLAAERPASRRALGQLAAGTRTVNAVARRTRDGRAGGDGAGDLPVAIARMNEAATLAGLPQCGL